MKSKTALIFWSIVTVVPIIGVLSSIFYPDLFFGTQEQAREFIEGYGRWGILLFVLIQIIQVIITPISHYTTSVIGGFLYGPILGGVFNWIGRVIGQFIAYFLSRRFGRPVVERFVNEETLERFDYIVAGDDKTLWSRTAIIFLMIFLPFFPDDEISYLAGLAGFKLKYFAAVTLLGHIGGSFALAYAGAGINTQDVYFWVLMTITLAFFVALMVALIRLRQNTEVSSGNN